MTIEVTEREARLLECFRSISEFNRQRILAMAASAYDSHLLTQKVKAARHPQKKDPAAGAGR